MKKIIIVFLLLFSSSILYAQNDVNALRFARIQNLGTARYMSMGGAFTALGGDISTLTDNPAGLGVFRNSQIVFTPAINLSQISSSNSRNDDKSSFQIGTLGAVASLYNSNFDWRGINIGLNYTNLNNFNRRGLQQVHNSSTSLLDIFAIRAGDYNPDELYNYDINAWLAYDTYLLNTDTNGYYQATLGKENVNQTKRFKEDGYQGEYAISFATNYRDKFMIGATVGIQSLKYKYSSTYTEQTLAESPSQLNFYDFNEHIRTEGTGINFKFGMIYIPIPQLRIGASIHTPTYYNLNEEVNNSIYSQFKKTDPTMGREALEYYQTSYEIPGFGNYDYNYKTPWRASFGVATVLGNRAIISADYEYVDYSNIHYSNASDYNDYSDLNRAIDELYQATHNIKLGAELRLSHMFSIRGGYNYLQNPYKHDYAMAQYLPSSREIQTVSAGLGVNAGRFFCDAAYMYRFGKNSSTFYYYYDDLGMIEAEPISNKFTDQQIRLTLGVRF